MNDKSQSTQQTRPSRFIGIDWADKEHEVCIIDDDGNARSQTLEQSPEAIEQWIAQQRQHGSVHIILEQTRGALAYALMFREGVTLYPINPKQFSSYRDSYTNAGCKSDETDARLLATMLRERIGSLRPWTPDDESTRKLARFSELRRNLVNERTRLLQQLTDCLKCCYSQALTLPHVRLFGPLMLELLRRYPDPRQLKKADRRVLVKVFAEFKLRNEKQQHELLEAIRSMKLTTTDAVLLEASAILIQTCVLQMRTLNKSITELEARLKQEMDQHPDAELFRSLPGAGQHLAPRLLAAFGSQRNRFASADAMLAFTGIAPVRKQSGRTNIVHRRYACPKHIRQTFHEFADHARRWCPWSKAYYQMQRSRGMKHHAALRKLASRWIRILFVVWKTNTPYDPARYLNTLRTKNPAIIPFLNA